VGCFECEASGSKGRANTDLLEIRDRPVEDQTDDDNKHARTDLPPRPEAFSRFINRQKHYAHERIWRSANGVAGRLAGGCDL